MLKVLSVFGTRPEAIKMAPVIRELDRHGAQIDSRICITAQHRGMLDQVLDLFGIRPDYDLDIMQDAQSPTQVMARVLAELEPILTSERPDWVLVQGDTTTTTAAALAAFYAGARVGHIEAGLRTFDNYSPFPEEMNRRLATATAALHFAPTETAADNLLFEGVASDRVLVTGNTVIDALQEASAFRYDISTGPLSSIPFDRKTVLVTSHRRENFGVPLTSICGAVLDIAASSPDVHVVFTVHPNPRVREIVEPLLDGIDNITLLPPLEYLPLVQLLKRVDLVLTDSGGLQEEAPALGKPVLVLRDATERPEAIKAGTALLVGTDRHDIKSAALRLLNDEAEYARMAQAASPYGDGHASARIVEALVRTSVESDSVPVGSPRGRAAAPALLTG